MNDKLKEAALEYHRYPTPGKIKITPTKALTTQKDLSLAYSPGVAAASELIHEDPHEASNLTARANLVAVVSNGTAVLGLGNQSPSNRPREAGPNWSQRTSAIPSSTSA